jgi:alpha-galactosidase
MNSSVRSIKKLTSVFFLMFFICSPVLPQTIVPGNGRDIPVKQWVESNFAKGKVPPFSFRLDGTGSEKFITGWKYSVQKEASSDPSVTKTLYTYTDPKTKISVNCLVTAYSDFPAVEWVVRFVNNSGTNSPVIDAANVIDKSFRYNGTGSLILHHSIGSDAKRSDFEPVDEPLLPGSKLILMPSGGRSSDNASLPFFNIEGPGKHGMVVAVGWTGKWHADIEAQDPKTVSLKSGMARMKLILYPGEEIRTPSICLLFWKADNRMAGHNSFRQFILAHHFRKIDGRFAEYPLASSFDYGDPAPCNEYNCLTADYAIALVKRYQQFKLVPEVFWLDAGWYTGCGWDKGDWWQNVGNWSPEKDRFPNGLRPVADAVHSVGSKFMVWFEPERVRKGTQFDKLNSDWLLKLPGDENELYNLGNRDARIYLTDYISNLIRKEGIDYYRQDFNFDPMPFWEQNDKPDRVGMSEIRHIEGLYAYWDSLLVRFPRLLIDNCASGGRRLDIETVSRSAPLWRTDYQYGEPNGYQCHTYGLSFYLPITGTAIYKSDNYTFRSGLNAAAVMNWEVTGRTSEPIPVMQKSMKEYKDLRPYYYGDYYPLTGTGNITTDSVWLAYQMNRPAEGDGIVLAFRRQDAQDGSITINLRGLDDTATYEVTDSDSGTVVKLTGSQLKSGYILKIAEKPGSALIRYKKLP